MIRLIFVFIILMISVFVGLQLSHSPGYVLIAFNHWTIETSLWFALFFLLIFIFLLHTLWLLFSKLGHIGISWHQYQLKRNQVKEQNRIYKKEYAILQEKLYLSSIVELARGNQREQLDKLINNLPRNFRYNSTLLAEYCRFLLETNQLAKAEVLLRKQLKKSLNEQFIELYGLCNANNKQLTFAESLLKKTHHSALLYLCVGRLSIYQKLWGKAKHYLEKSVELDPTPAAYKELGFIYDELNEPTTARMVYKKGLDLLSH